MVNAVGDVGDYWRENREFKRKMRSFWYECPNCDFGGNPPKVAPGFKCHHCGWQAPGKQGDDIKKAREAQP